MTTASECVADGPNLYGAKQSETGTFSVRLQDQFGLPREFTGYPSEELVVLFDGVSSAGATFRADYSLSAVVCRGVSTGKLKLQHERAANSLHVADSPFVEIVSTVGPASVQRAWPPARRWLPPWRRETLCIFIFGCG